MGYGLLIAVAGLATAMYTLWARQAWHAIWEVEDSYYSHSLLIPFIAGYLLWRKRSELARVPVQPDWRGLLIAGTGLLLFIPGTFADMLTFSGLSFIAILAGIVWSLYGRGVARLCAFPILYLIFMVPVSTGLLEPIAFSLRLLSTKMAIVWLGLFGQHAMAEGTSIIFSTMRVEVPNACSGMQSLMALTAALSAFVYIGRGLLWRRLSLLAIIPPLLVVSNGLRVALISMIGRLFGVDVAEGPLHGTSSALVFLLTFAALLGFAHVLAVTIDLGSGSTDTDNTSDPHTWSAVSWLPRASFASLGLIALLLMGNWFKLTLRPPEAGIEGPPLVDFSAVPLEVEGWKGKNFELDPATQKLIYANSLLSRIYTNENGEKVSLLVEYRPGPTRVSFHQPDACMPAAGWSTGISRSKVVAAGQLSIPLTSIVFRKGKFTRLELFWHRYGGTYAEAGSRLAMRMELAGPLGRLFGRRQSETLFRVGALVTTSPQQTFEAQKDLIEKILPSVEKAIAAGDAQR